MGELEEVKKEVLLRKVLAKYVGVTHIKNDGQRIAIEIYQKKCL
jgi:hypothetical protein